MSDIRVEDVLAIREQIFAEAVMYYRAYPTDWWQLSSEGQTAAQEERDARRQSSVYENSLRDWLQNKTQTAWEEIAEHYLELEVKRSGKTNRSKWR